MNNLVISSTVGTEGNRRYCEVIVRSNNAGRPECRKTQWAHPCESDAALISRTIGCSVSWYQTVVDVVERNNLRRGLVINAQA